VKAKDQHNYIEKDGKFICKVCSREFSSKASFGAHMSWHSSGSRPNLVKHLEEARQNIDQSYRMKCVREAQDLLYFDPEWLDKKNKNISEGHKRSKKAALQRHERSQKGAAAKMRTQLRYVYDGVKFRSTYEVRFAYVLDMLEIDWDYEPCRFVYSISNSEGYKNYTPDFYLPELDIYVEVSGCMPNSKAEKLVAVCNQNEILLLVVDGLVLGNLGLNNDEIKFSKSKIDGLIYANTEPSQIRNSLEGVETTIESLKQQFFAMASKLHESLLTNNVSERYSPNLQETVRAEDKELQVNTNVIYCPYIPLFTTPTLITSDLMAQKGFLSSAGFKVINAGLFCRGKITHLGEGYQM